jgi:hypothetical protein
MIQPDRLFRDKLEDYQLNAPAKAWERIRASTGKSSDRKTWLKVAAGLALLVSVSALIWGPSPENKADGSETVVTEQPANDLQNENQPVASHVHDEVTKNEKNPTPIKARATKVVSTGPSANPVVVSTDESLSVSETYAGEISVSDELEDTETYEAVYLVYTAEEVNEKYLRKQPVREATHAEKKSSRMQKLMSIANNLKSNEGGFGDLRQMKDEIFALNFLDDKKEQSKKH